MPTRTNRVTGEVQELRNGQWVTIVPGNGPMTVQTRPPNPMLPAQVTKAQNEAAASRFAPGKAATDARIAQLEARIKSAEAATASAKSDTDLKIAQANLAKTQAELQALRMQQPEFKQKQSAEALLKAAGVDLAKGIDPIEKLIRDSTSGPLQAVAANAAGAITGHATPGMENIAKLQTIVSDMTLQLTGGSLGNQISNADREFIMQRVGNLGDPSVPADQRLAAWNQVKERMGNVLGIKPQLSEDAIKQELEARLRSGEDPADTIQWLVSINRPPNKEEIARIVANRGNQNPRSYFSNRPPEPGTYADSYLAQGLSGANEGLASVLGAPADLTAAAINLIPKGINAIANTNIPTLPNPVGGGEWWKNLLTNVGSIQSPTNDPAKQFVRRTGESVGAAAVPAGFAGSLPRAGALLLSGLGGGMGAATAQQVAPGNPLAELGGELLGGAAVGGGAVRAAQRAAQSRINAAVPTVENLKQEAANLYRLAETRGVTATPAQTRKLATDIRATLRKEGQLGPNGKITSTDTNTSKAFNLIQQYAGRPMKPSEMNTVRTVLAEGRQSSDPSDRRLAGILLSQFDDWVSPLAPEFANARSVASRYLQAEDLERARELAGARARQFTGSGFENALRTEYRGLDRGIIKGNQYFSPDVANAVRKVARGTPISNFWRNVGRLAPTGPVPIGGSMAPGMLVGAMADPATGGMVSGSLMGAGLLGRKIATDMGIRAADEAELIARNGGSLPQAPWIDDFQRRLAAWLAAAEQAKYLQDHQGN